MFYLKDTAFSILFIVSLFGFAFASSPIDPECQIKGTVVDQNGSAVVGAVIEVSKSTLIVGVTTDSAGEFSVSLPAGNYVFAIRASGFDAVRKIVTVKPDENEGIEVVLEIEAATAVVNVSDGGVYQVGAISSAMKTFTALRDIPQSISITTKDQINDQSMTGIGDVVRYQPGVTAHQGENNRDQVVIRGQSSSADFFVNGVRDDVQYYRDLYNLEKVEILRGPNALAFGRGGGGGVVNRVTKEADHSRSYQFSLLGGSYGSGRATFDLNQPLGSKLAVRGNGIISFANSFRRDVNMHRIGFNPTLTFDPDANTHITVSYEYFRDRRVADRGITSFRARPADVPISTYYGNPHDSRVRSNTNLFSTYIDRQFGDLTVRNRLMYGDYDRGYQNYVPGVVNSTGTLVTLTAYNNTTRRKNLFDQIDLIYIFETGFLKHTFVGGAEFGRQRSDNFRNTGYFNDLTTSIQVPFGDPTTPVPVTFRQSATDANNRVAVNLGAAYLQDQIAIGRYVQLIAGARFDRFDLKFHNNRNNSDLRRVDDLVSPRFGLVLRPVEPISLYGSYAVSFLPSSGDQFSSLTDVTQQVDPERFTNFEIGAKWDLKPMIQITAAVYRLDRTNTRSVDPNDPTRIIQTGRQRTNGAEIGLNGSINRRWSLTGGYAYQDALITNATVSAAAGKQVAQVPHHNFSLWNKYQLLRRFAAGLGIVYRSNMFAGVDNTVVLPGYTRADAGVYYSLSESWRLQANVENLFDTRYFLNADSNTNISPGSPRAIKISLTAHF